MVLSIQAQHHNKKSKSSIPKEVTMQDTISLPAGYFFISPTRVFFIPEDTTVIISCFRKLSWSELQTIRSSSFYDSAYRKLNKSKVTKLLYDLAFVEPTEYSPTSEVITQKNDIPFLPFENRVIGRISIQVLNPFGTSISDTSLQIENKANRFGNNLHINTRKSVLRHQLRIKQGQRLNPNEIADNLRMIKELPFIDDARFIITETSPGSDSVDVMLIAKDNWSIGGNLVIIDLTRYRGSIYDGNFLGSGDRFTVDMSIDGDRAPFLRFDGLSYDFTNINGSFVNVSVSLYQDNTGNQNFTVTAVRPFFSFTTKYAFGAGFTLGKVVSEGSDGSTKSGSYHQESFWIGSSSPLRDQTTRFVLTGGFFNQYYIARPTITIDSNAGFYNITRFLAGISVYKSLYYNTDYILQFGQVESIPYGFLYQLTMGPVITDYYTRFYFDLGISAGNFIKKFGYLYGQLHLGGFLNRDQVEDGLLKIKGEYMSNLYKTPNKRYKFRSFVSSQVLVEFNPRTNNLDAYELRDYFDIKSIDIDSLYTGNKVFSIMASTISYTPWYFYGFHFALQASFEVGVVAQKGERLIDNQLFTGFGLTFSIENSNLIFPSIVFSCFIYPTSPGIPFIQFNVSQISSENYNGFSPGAPYIQTIQN